jgi:hemin uptake protein HemP
MRPFMTGEPAHPQAPPAPMADTRVLTSRELFAGDRKVLINHDGELYTLQITRQGKLLLTK